MTYRHEHRWHPVPLPNGRVAYVCQDCGQSRGRRPAKPKGAAPAA